MPYLGGDSDTFEESLSQVEAEGEVVLSTAVKTDIHSLSDSEGECIVDEDEKRTRVKVQD